MPDRCPQNPDSGIPLSFSGLRRIFRCVQDRFAQPVQNSVLSRNRQVNPGPRHGYIGKFPFVHQTLVGGKQHHRTLETLESPDAVHHDRALARLLASGRFAPAKATVRCDGPDGFLAGDENGNITRRHPLIRNQATGIFGKHTPGCRKPLRRHRKPFHLGALGAGCLNFGTDIKPVDGGVDLQRIAQVFHKTKSGCLHIFRQFSRLLMDPLVAVVEHPQDTPRFESGVERNPPVLPEILSLIHDDRVIPLIRQALERGHQHVRSLVVPFPGRLGGIIRRRPGRGIRRRIEPGALFHICAQTVEGSDLEGRIFPQPPLRPGRKRAVEADKQHPPPPFGLSRRLLEGQHGLARAGRAADGHPRLLPDRLQDPELVPGQNLQPAVIRRQQILQRHPEMHRVRQNLLQRTNAVIAQRLLPVFRFRRHAHAVPDPLPAPVATEILTAPEDLPRPVRPQIPLRQGSVRQDDTVPHPDIPLVPARGCLQLREQLMLRRPRLRDGILDPMLDPGPVPAGPLVAFRIKRNRAALDLQDKNPPPGMRDHKITFAVDFCAIRADPEPRTRIKHMERTVQNLLQPLIDLAFRPPQRVPRDLLRQRSRPHVRHCTRPFLLRMAAGPDPPPAAAQPCRVPISC